MSRDLERITALTEQLVSHVEERIEYRFTVKTHTAECTADMACMRKCACPTISEPRVRTVRHAPLITQLEDVIADPVSAPESGGRSATQVDASLPGNFEALDLINEIRSFLWSAVRRARLLCGYDVAPSSVIRGYVCGNCGGALRVADGKAVCIGPGDGAPPCGTEYTWHQIADMIGGAG